MKRKMSIYLTTDALVSSVYLRWVVIFMFSATRYIILIYIQHLFISGLGTTTPLTKMLANKEVKLKTPKKSWNLTKLFQIELLRLLGKPLCLELSTLTLNSFDTVQ